MNDSKGGLIAALRTGLDDAADCVAYADLDGSEVVLDGRFELWKIADAVIAAGWRPPARVVEAVGDLGTLPPLSVILGDDGYVYRSLETGGGAWKWFPLDTQDHLDRDMGVKPEDVAFPVTVLWESGDPR